MKNINNYIIEKFKLDSNFHSTDIFKNLEEIFKDSSMFKQNKDIIFKQIKKQIGKYEKSYIIGTDTYYEKFCKEHNIDKKLIIWLSEEDLNDYIMPEYEHGDESWDFRKTWEDKNEQFEIMCCDGYIGINYDLNNGSSDNYLSLFIFDKNILPD